MQDHHWDDLKFLLALHRTGWLAAAGRRLGVNETTVARRLDRLERQLGAPLFVRNALGQHEATETARGIIRRAETIERENAAIREGIGREAGRLAGLVRVSSVPVIVNRILVPGLGALRAAQPDLTVALVPEARNLDLTKREADLAVRFAHPVQGGLATRAQKLGELEFAAFCAAAVAPADEETLGWIGYDDGHAFLPQARWIEAEAAGPAALRVADAETALEAVAAGLGKSILPVAACRGDTRMRRISQRRPADKLARDVWLLSHADQAARGSVAAVKAWLAGLDWH